jgi:hypothetical protein
MGSGWIFDLCRRHEGKGQKDKGAANEEGKRNNKRHDRLRSLRSTREGGTAYFYTLKNKHVIKMGCDGLAWLLWTLPDEYRFSCFVCVGVHLFQRVKEV